MARETSRFNREVLDVLAPRDEDRILEIGFGHGRTLLDAATRAPGATLAGIDISPDAERVAIRRCRAVIEAQRLELRTGDAATLPWSDRAFSAVFAVHSIYFWPQPAAQLAEIRRITRPDGRFVLGMRERTGDIATRFPSSVYRFYSNDELADLLHAAGFARVDVRSASTGPDLRIALASA